MSTIPTHRLTIPFALMLSVFLLYAGTFDLGFFSDDFEGIARYDRLGLSGLGTNYENVFFMPFSFLFQAVELQISSHYAFAKVINLLLFGGTSIFLFLLARRLFTAHKQGQFAALVAALIFICSPYQTEAINWFSSQAYVLSTFFSVWALWILMREKQSKFTPFIFGVLFFLALLNKEISLCLPFIAALLLFYQNENRRSKLKKVLRVSLLVLLVYFVLRWLTLGTPVGGYGSAVHMNFSPSALLQGLSAYFAKFFGFYRYLPAALNKAFALVLLMLCVALFVLREGEGSTKRKLLLILLLCFVLSLLPVINLETSFLENVQSDRYGYFPSIFFSLFAAAILTHLSYSIRYWVAAFWVALSVLFLFNTQSVWEEAATIRDEFKVAIKTTNLSDFYLLNVPDNYKGVYIFRHGIEECLGEEKTIRPLAFQHLNGPSKVNEWNDVKNAAILIHSSSRFVPCAPFIGQQASAYEGRTCLTIPKNATGEIPVLYFDPESGKIYACSTE